jgi:GDP-L-fucose synthase
LIKDKSLNVVRTKKKELNFFDKNAVNLFFKNNNFDQIYITAAKVGGIKANNDYPATFILENLIIQTNLISSAFENNIKKILFFGSSCIYPKNSNQPIRETELLNGKLEITNEAYALAKITGVKMCDFYNKQFYKTKNIDYRSVMPCNLYGLGDRYDSKYSHVIPALIQKFHNAKINKKKSITVWGSGEALREFLNVNDLAKASILIMNLKRSHFRKILPEGINHINIGSDQEISIKSLSYLIAKIVGFNGQINFDKRKNEGVRRKILDNSILRKLGWKQSINLEEGLRKTYKDFLKNNI